MHIKNIKNIKKQLGAAIIGAGAALLLTGCMEFDHAGEIQLATHVSDWREEIIYQLMVDRFDNGDQGNDYRVDLSAEGKYHGGDYRGVENRLDYLSELGVTTLWISPVVKNVDTDAGFDAYHGYWAQDLYMTNPHFGDLESLRRLVSKAHERNIKVILDIVTNHMGQIFYYDVNRNGEPDDRVAGDGRGVRYGDNTVLSAVTHMNEYDPDFDLRGIQSFTSLGEAGPAPIVFVYDPASNHIPPTGYMGKAEAYNGKGRTVNFDIPEQLLMGDFPGGLKDVNTTLCGVKEIMVDAYARWVELTDLDGFRIDTVKHVEKEFWRYFTQRVRQRLAARGKTNFLMFGEVFDGRDDVVGTYTKKEMPTDPDRENSCDPSGAPLTGDMLDSVFYFPQHFRVIRDVFQSAGPTKGIETLWQEKLQNYGSEPMEGGPGISPQELLVNFLDNHDVPRFLNSGKGVEALHNALLFLFTVQGIPCIYYGTEQQFSGGNDPANREDLWKSEFDTNNATFQWIKKISAIRKSYPAISKGGLTIRWSTDHVGTESDAGIFAFERSGGDAGDGYALIVFNTNPNQPSSTSNNGAIMTVGAPAGTTLVDVLSGTPYTVDGTQGLNITLAQQTAAVLVPQNQAVPLP